MAQPWGGSHFRNHRVIAPAFRRARVCADRGRDRSRRPASRRRPSRLLAGRWPRRGCRRDVLNRRLRNLVDEADIGILSRRDPRDDLAPCHLGIYDRFTAAAAIVDHDDDILHVRKFDVDGQWSLLIFRIMSSESSDNRKTSHGVTDSGSARPNRPARPGGTAISRKTARLSGRPCGSSTPSCRATFRSDRAAA